MAIAIKVSAGNADTSHEEFGWLILREGGANTFIKDNRQGDEYFKYIISNSLGEFVRQSSIELHLSHSEFRRLKRTCVI